MDLEDIMMANRVKQILENKIRQEGGCSDCNGTCGNGVLVGDGVMVGGKRKRKPSAFNKRVAAYMKKTGVSLPVAARRMAGSKTSKKKRPAKRRRVRGGADDDIETELKKLEKQVKILSMQDKLDAFEQDEPPSILAKKQYCNPKMLDKLTSEKEINAWYKKCKANKQPTYAEWLKAKKLVDYKDFLTRGEVEIEQPDKSKKNFDKLYSFVTESLRKERPKKKA